MIKIYSIEEAKKWDELVRTFANYDVYYLSGYVKAFQIHGDGEPQVNSLSMLKASAPPA